MLTIIVLLRMPLRNLLRSLIEFLILLGDIFLIFFAPDRAIPRLRAAPLRAGEDVAFSRGTGLRRCGDTAGEKFGHRQVKSDLEFVI